MRCVKFMRRTVIAACLLILAGKAGASTNYYFYVQFTDKGHSTYSLSNPSAFLSERAIARRASFGISCDSTDLPLSPTYLQQIKNLGIGIRCVSKWMNGATVILSDSGLMNQVKALPFVRFVEYTGKIDGASMVKSMKAKTSLNYGVANTQINQLNGKYLHNLGFKGKGIQIGVIDAGFTNVNTNVCFDSLRLQGRLLGTKNISAPTQNIYSLDDHGAMVLSSMAGNLPGQYLGTAPDAAYWLISTEYVPTEYKVETDFWCAGIEYADSVGVDVVNSSLGYFTFDDPSMNFTYSDMNGNVARSSRAAKMASQKGIICCISAGNEGNDTWHYISTPADADGIVTVGSVKADSTSSTFSSYGPSSDNRVKPEICAMGSSTALVSTSGYATYGNGTSFASPVMAGMMACYLQAAKKYYTTLPDVPRLLHPVFESGHHYANPTAQQGYGIPNFEKATQLLIASSGLKTICKNDGYTVTYSGNSKTLQINCANSLFIARTASLYSTTGILLKQIRFNVATAEIQVDNLPKGIYIISLKEGNETHTKKMILN